MKLYSSSLLSLFTVLALSPTLFAETAMCPKFYGSKVAAAMSLRKKGADWPEYTGGRGNQYSKLRMISKRNIKEVKPLWRIASPDSEILKNNKDLHTMANEVRPIAIDGDLYFSTSLSQVMKVDGVTGNVIWKFDPETHKGDYPPNLGFVHRGVSYWSNKDKTDERIIYGTGDAFLIALNAKTGVPIKDFGDNGRIDLLKGLARDGSDWPVRFQYGVSSPVSIYRDTLIIGSTIDDIPKTTVNPPGDVRGFDIKTGKLNWTFHTIPHKGEPGYDTWKNGSAEKNGQANVWSLMTVDKKSGLIYLPISTPSNDYYGGNRPGSGLYGESLACLDATTGKLKWQYQLVHHGVWDYDLPAAPNLSELVIDGKRREIVSVVTKQAFTYVFDRKTGEPIWPINETAVTASVMEELAATQPFPSKPPAFDRQGVTDADFLDENSKAIAQQYIYGPVFTPPTDKTGLGNNNGKETKGTLTFPGNVGGASWAGASFHPKSSLLIVTSVTLPKLTLLEKKPDGTVRYALEKSTIVDLEGKPHTLPLLKPPYGRISAIDMKKGEIKWQVPLGVGPVTDPTMQAALKGTEWEGKNVGWARRGHMLLTRDLLFVGQGSAQNVIGLSPKLNAVITSVVETPGQQNIFVYDPFTGKLLHTIDTLEGAPAGSAGNAQGGLMTYLDKNGKQRIVMPVGGATMPADWIVLGIP